MRVVASNEPADILWQGDFMSLDISFERSTLHQHGFSAAILLPPQYQNSAPITRIAGLERGGCTQQHPHTGESGQRGETVAFKPEQGNSPLHRYPAVAILQKPPATRANSAEKFISYPPH
jgi:hypothetical protein